MLQVQSAGFDPTLDVQKEQGLAEGDAELAVLTNRYPFLGVQETGRGRFIDPAVFLFEMLNGVTNFRTPGSPWKVSTFRTGVTRF